MAEASDNSKSSPDQSSSDVGASNRENVLYFCHKCQREVEGVGQEFLCPRCGSGFLEILDRDSTGPVGQPRRTSSNSSFQSQDDVGTNVVDFEEFMRHIAFPMLHNIFQNPQRPAAPAGPTSAPAGPTSAPAGPTFVPAGSSFAPAGHSFIPSGPSFTQAGFNPSVPTAASGTQQQQPPAPLFQGFFQNLFEGLTNNGVFQVQFQVDNGEGRQGFGFPMPLHGSPGDYAWGPGGLDAIVTQLLNQVEGGSPPMSREKIENLPDVEISKEQTDKRIQCAVCMDEFKLNETVKQLVCEHLFHIDCIKPWLERHNSCPVCRKSAEPDRKDAAPDRNEPGGSSGSRQPQSNTARSRLEEIDELD